MSRIPWDAWMVSILIKRNFILMIGLIYTTYMLIAGFVLNCRKGYAIQSSSDGALSGTCSPCPYGTESTVGLQCSPCQVKASMDILFSRYICEWILIIITIVRRLYLTSNDMWCVYVVRNVMWLFSDVPCCLVQFTLTDWMACLHKINNKLQAMPSRHNLHH